MSTEVHDAFFKASFSQPEHAAGELRAVLPPEISARIDFASLKLEPGSFVDEAFAKQHSDLLFSAKIAGRGALLYLLCEHQSAPHPLMPYRLLKYMVAVWDVWLEAHPKAKKLPLILPVVVHHSPGGWTAAIAFEELLDADADLLVQAAPYVPHFRFLLDDLDAEADEALRARTMTAFGRLVLYCLKNARDPDELVRGLERWSGTMREILAAPNGVAALGRVFRYIGETNEHLSPEELRALVARHVGPEAQEAVVTMAERLREEGREEGRKEGLQQGREQGRREALLQLLKMRFGKVTKAVTARVNAAGIADLDLWFERAVTAETPAEVFEPASTKRPARRPSR